VTSSFETTADPAPPPAPGEVRAVLVVAWCAGEPGRAGEVLRVPASGAAVLGRAGDPLVRPRPGGEVETGPPTSPRLSRQQLRARVLRDGHLHVENVGRRGMHVRGAPMADAVLAPGDVVRFEDDLVLRCSSRPALPAGRAPTDFAWGGPDAGGFVGESPAAWALRDRLAFVAAHDGDVLLLGGVGAGKGTAAAVLRRLVGEVRVVDVATATALPPGGARLVVQATGPLDAVPAAVRARCRHVVALPTLDERRDDVPLIALHRVREAFAADPDLRARFADETGAPRLAAAFVEGLLRHPMPLELRDLDALVWEALAGEGDRLEATPALLALGRDAPPPAALTAREREVVELFARGATYQQVADALGIAIGTVQDYVKSAYRKLDASTKAEAVAEALRRGLVDP
jgi:DNA-binding CsgD family transcriptional regulator